MYMLLGSHWILNGCDGKESMEIYPHILTTMNLVSFDDITTPIKIPDQVPGHVFSSDPLLATYGRDYSMVAGDFLQVYSRDQYGKPPGKIACDLLHQL